MTSLATAFVDIRPNTTGFGARLSRTVSTDATRAGTQAGNRFTSAFRGPMGKLAGMVAGAFAVSKGVGFLKDSIGAASDLGETMSKVGVVFGGGADQVVKFASDAATSLGQSKQAALDAAATFGTMGKVAGLTGRENAKFSTSFTKLASDMASFSNTSPEEAVEAIGSALRGEAEPIRRYGVLLDDATLRNEALRLGLVKTTKEALTPQQKVLAAQAAIMKQTGDAQGDFARTSGGLANQQRILSAQFENVKAKVGSAFLPVITNVVGFLNKSLMPAFGKVSDAVKYLFGQGDVRNQAAGFAEILDNVFGNTGKLVGPLTEVGVAIRTAKGAVEGFIYALKTGNTSEDSGVVGFAVRLGAVIRNDVLPALGSLVESFRTNLLPVVQNFAGVLVSDVLPGVISVVGWFAQHMGATKALAATIGALVAITRVHAAVMAVQAAGGLMAMIKGTKTVTALTRTWAAVQWLMNAALTANPIGLVIAAVAGLVVGLVVAYKKSETFRNIVNGALNAVKDAAQFLWDRMRSFFGWLGDGFRKMGDLAGDFRKAVGSAWDAVKRGTQTAVLFVVDKVLWLAEKMLGAMARAFSWVPGLGPKLRKASDEVAGFRAAVNREMDKINDEDVKVTVKGYTSFPGSNRAGPGGTVGPGKDGGLAKGGPIPLVPGSVAGKDSVRALLMPGEHVLTVDEVKKAGGHKAIFALREGIKRGVLPVSDEGRPLGFANGGPVFNVRTALPPTGPIVAVRDAFARREAEAMQERLKEMAAAARARRAAASAYSGAGTPNGNGGLGPAAIKAANFVRSFFGFHGTIGGYSYRNIAGTNTLSKHAIGKAIDIMQPVSPLAQRMFDYFRGPGANRFGVDNAIYNRQIWNRSGGLHYYSGVSPHTDHVHVDFFDKGGIARGAGSIRKQTVRPERVLSPRQTESFERLVEKLERGGLGGPAVVMENVYTRDEAELARKVRLEQEKALALAVMP